MKIELHASTRWANCSVNAVIDTWEDLGVSDEEWDNMPDVDRQYMLQDCALDMVGFSFAANY
jgi:hypothetical protein